MIAPPDEGRGRRPPPPPPARSHVPPPPLAPPESKAPAEEVDAAERRSQTRWLVAVSAVALLLILAAVLMLLAKGVGRAASSGIYEGNGAGEAAGTGSGRGGGEGEPDPRSAPAAVAASGEPDRRSEQQVGSPEENAAPIVAQDAEAEQQPSLILLERRAVPPRVVLPGGEAGTGGGAGADAARFFGVWDKGKRFVYVVDRSGSMRSKIAATKQELARSIQLLQADRQFYVIFYSSTPLALPPLRLWQATDQGKAFALRWVEGVSAEGGTEPLQAVMLALRLKPDAVFLLSDGHFSVGIAGQIRQANPGAQIRIHTLAFHDQSGEQVLKRIAEENNGIYRFVPGPGPPTPPGVGLPGFGRAP